MIPKISKKKKKKKKKNSFVKLSRSETVTLWHPLKTVECQAFMKSIAKISVFTIYFYVKAYLGIKSMKLVRNDFDHIVTADKYTPR